MMMVVHKRVWGYQVLFFSVPKAVGVRFVGSSDADPIKYDAEISSKHSGYHLPQISVWPF